MSNFKTFKIMLRYYRNYSFPEIWEEFFTDQSDRYELVEKPSYKKKRLEDEKLNLEKWLEYNKKQVVATEDKLKSVKKELDSL
jgi:hypothetical protein